MAATAWPSTLVRSDWDADKPCKTSRAEDLRDRAQVLLTTPFSYRLNGNISGNDSREIQILEHWLDNVLHVGLYAKILAGTGEGRARILIRDQTGGVDRVTGDWVSFTASDPSFDTLDLTVTLTSADLRPFLDDFGSAPSGRLQLRAEVESVSGTGTKVIFSADRVASYVADG